MSHDELLHMIRLTITESHENSKGEIHHVKSDLQKQIQDVKAELKQDIHDL